MLMAKMTAAYVVAVGAVAFSMTRPSSGLTLWYLPQQMNLIALVLMALFIPVVVYGWRRALADQRATQAAFRNREQLAALTPEQFERWCQSRLVEAGYRTQLIGGQGDHGIDLMAERDGQWVVVQCKRYAGRKPVGEPHLRDLYGAMHDRNAARAIVITSGYFTPAARAWAAGKPIELWDLDHLAQLKPSTAVAPVVTPSVVANACPRCGSALVERRNRSTEESFLGCSAYPRCRYTRAIA